MSAVALRMSLLVVCLAVLAGCTRPSTTPATPTGAAPSRGKHAQGERASDLPPLPEWRMPVAELGLLEDAAAVALARQAQQMHWIDQDANAALPILLAVLQRSPEATDAQRLLGEIAKEQAAQIRRQLPEVERDAAVLASVLRAAAGLRQAQATGAWTDARALLPAVDAAAQAWQWNEAGDAALREGRYGAQGGGALAAYRAALALQPTQTRAQDGIVAVEAGLIDQAIAHARVRDFSAAEHWLALAESVRPEQPEAVQMARSRVETIRRAVVVALRDAGLLALPHFNGINTARAHFTELLRMATPGDPAAAELRQRIERAVRFGMFQRGQVFSDPFQDAAGRGPLLVVIPHGELRMGSEDTDPTGENYERPARTVAFPRGLAMAVHEVTVGEFRRYAESPGVRTRAGRRGYSMAYDPRGGYFVRRGYVDWRHDYMGALASDDMPVIHVSAGDADGYAHWLSAQTGRNYRIPSEAEFEYALRAGGRGGFPWGDGAPPPGSGNLTGALDRSPDGRRWSNAFTGYGDGHWGPAPTGRFHPNAFGLHDMAGNVSEWVADCWHDSYRRAPRTATAWFNPGCRSRVVRGGSWSSSPDQTRSAWRAPADVDNTNPRVGFRVVRDL